MEQHVPMKVHEAIFNQILDKPENKVCADCPNRSPTWASIDFGVFVCLRCSGAHRRLSPVVTRVRSAKIDDWKMDHIQIMAAVGNKLANDYWECNAPSYYKKPDLSTSLDDVFEMVKTKYVKAAYAPKDRLNPVKEFLEAIKDGETTAGSFNQAKMAQITKTPQVTVNTTTTTKTAEKKTSIKTHNLIDMDDDGDFGDFKSAPEKTTKLDIPKPSVEVKFVSNNGQPQKSTSDLWDLNFDTRTPSTNLQKTTSADPFSFDQPNTQKTNSTPSDSNKLYDLYKTGNQTTQNTTKPGNGPNFSGGQSNYAYLDMMGGGGNQQKFNQPQQPFGFQGGMNSNNQFYGGVQNKPTGFNSQPGMNGGFGSSGYGANNGFNSFGSGGYSSGPAKPTFGTQQQQPQPFTFGQPTTTTTTSTFSFNTVTPTQNFSQPTTVKAGFSFL